MPFLPCFAVVTVTETPVEPLTPVPDPETVTVDVPVGVEVVGLTVNVTASGLVEVIFTELELRLQFAPVGQPVTISDTIPVNEPDGVTVIVLLPEEPCFTEKLVGEAESEMPFGAGAFTVSETLVELERLLWTESVPVTASVAVPVAVDVSVPIVSCVVTAELEEIVTD